MISEAKEIAESIAKSEKSKRDLARSLREPSRSLGLIEPSKPRDLNGIKIAGVDGGIVKKSLHGFDLILARAIGVCFYYTNNKVSSVSYHPSKNHPAKPFSLESHSEVDFLYFSSMARQQLEVQRAIECLEKFDPDYFLMDGPIVPHYATKPTKSSPIYKEYEKLVSLYKELHSKAKCTIAGIVEDSRSDRFCTIMAKALNQEIDRKSLERSRDTSLLYWMLEKGEKTTAFPYADKSEAENDIGVSIFSFYLKTSQYDRPIRVDFSDKSKENEIASILLSISGYHSGYGYPTVLIEADNVAKLSENEIELFYSYILKHTRNLPGTMLLRREQRPF